MYKILLFILLGYLAGSILFARVAARIFNKEEIINQSKDKNPGTANAFTYGGFGCGLFTLIGDLGKGFLPVFLCMRYMPEVIHSQAFALVLAAPVLGHCFPLGHFSQGGKGIAVSFGSLLGLMPIWQPAIWLAACFIFFSLVVVVSPNFQRTIITYLCALILMVLVKATRIFAPGFALISGLVFLRMHMSREERQATEVKLLWMH
jgi:glycerol-3-phosphate acyltransferase PlsY